MALSPGTRLGAYEILGGIGVGGMGEVYRARDLKLDRDVAIKVLPESFAQDADRVARFTREAHTLASLNHPGIAAIYGIEESAGRRALVMELVEGEDLSVSIGRGPVPMAEALAIARQIAEALEAAHDHGVVHRDLKPANIKVRPDGAVKVLDFGLAKALATDATSASAQAMNSPTLTARATELGMILGTAAYMAPEQAKGRGVDRRADIWAFGCVLYEMLTGKRAFEGEDVSETMASVLRAEVDWSALPPETPRRVVNLLHRCLERDVRQRLQAIGEARIELARSAATSSDVSAARSSASGARLATARTPMWVWIALAAIAGAAAAVIVMQPRQSNAAPAAVQKFLVATDAPPDNVALSPDGRQLLIVAGTRLQVRDLDQLQPHDVSGVPELGVGENAPGPAWSPDGKSIVYGTGGRIWRIPSAGGTPTVVCDSPGAFRGAAWKPDGLLVLSTVRGPMYEVSASGGDPRVLIALNGQDDVDFHDPFVLPDGRALLYSVHRRQGVDTIEVFSAGTRKVVMRLEGRARESPQVLNTPVYSPTGHLLYRLEQGNAGIWAVPFSLSRLEATGDPFLVAAGGSWPSITANGLLAYAAPRPTGPRQLVLFRPDGSIDRTIGEPRNLLRQPRFSPDGRRIAFVAEELNSDVWISNADGTGARRITSTPDNESDVIWNPIGNAVTFVCPAAVGSSICTRNADGSGEIRTIAAQASSPAYSPDGHFLLYDTNGEKRRGLLVLDLQTAGAKAQEYVMRAEALFSVAILPGSKFAVYWGYASGRPTTFLRSFPRGDSQWEVPVLNASRPKLLSDGKTIAAIEPRPDGSFALIGVSVETQPAVTFGSPRTLFSALPESFQLDAEFDVTPDGSRLLAVVSKGAGPVQRGVVVVLNWFSEFSAGK